MSNCGSCCNFANISYPGSWSSSSPSVFVVNSNWLICNYRAYKINQDYYLNEKKGNNYAKFINKNCDNNCTSINNTFNSYEDYLHFKKAKDRN